jgi:hypothetical protein
MAYMNQDKKKSLAPQIKAVLAKYGMKATIGVNNYSTLVVNIREGKLDLIGQANRDNEAVAARRGDRVYKVEGNYQVNPYYAHESGDAKIGRFFEELIAAMKGKMWYDNSDIMTDYFDTAYYLDINVGKWDKPYKLTA